MSSPTKLPKFDPSVLRDHGTDEALDRVWQRVDADLPSVPRRRAALWWAPATLVIVFGCGVFVGARWFAPPEPVAAVPLTAERPASGDDRSSRGAAEQEAPSAVEAPVTQPTTAPPTRLKRSPVISSAVPEAEEPTSAPTNSAPPTAVLPPAGPPEWVRLAQLGEYKRARGALEKAGGFDAVIQQATPGQLMMLTDIARATGQHGRAVQALRMVVDRFPSDPNAPLAAWTLGTLLERAGDQKGAAQAYAAYRSLSPKGDFAEDALARQVESAIAAGNVELARKLAKQYEKDFPAGRSLRRLKAKLSKLTGDKTPEAAADAGAGSAEESPSSESDDESDESAPTAEPSASQ